MKTFTERILWVAVLLLVTGLFIVGCGDDETEDVEDLLLEEEEAAGTTLIEVPPAYVFDSRFAQGESLVVQHKKPTAIAQIHQYLKTKESDKLHVVSVPLIKYYLAAQGLEAAYTPIKSAEDLAKLDKKLDDTSELVAIGSPLHGRAPKTKKTFYHNPYVNRMWPELSVFEY